MMHHRTIGDADVYNIVELIGPTHDPARLYPDLPRGEFEKLIPSLIPAQYAASTDRLIIGIQIWIVKIGAEVIIIDTGIGNAKPRGLPRFDQLNTLVPEWLAAIGAGPEQVTQVINTHLHGDHVGWNTVADGNDWVATFPNASYWFPQIDYDWWLPIFVEKNGIGETEAFTDAVMPLVNQGRAQFYQAGHVFASGLSAASASGHTPGQMRIDLVRNGQKGVFCADIFHSPLQILRPDINTVVDVEGDIARTTRLAFLEEMADTDTLVMPCHFGAPHCVRIVRKGDGFDFVPG